MTLESQVCSLELARKLKELGVKQDSYFRWYRGKILRGNQLTQELRRGAPPVSAFTVAELGEMLPRLANYRIWQQHSTNSSKLAGKWAITINDVKDDKFDDLTADTEADARAKMLIYLIKTKLISTPNGKMYKTHTAKIWLIKNPLESNR
jgi:hypothetical protein